MAGNTIDSRKRFNEDTRKFHELPEFFKATIKKIAELPSKVSATGGKTVALGSEMVSSLRQYNNLSKDKIEKLISREEQYAADLNVFYEDHMAAMTQRGSFSLENGSAVMTLNEITAQINRLFQNKFDTQIEKALLTEIEHTNISLTSAYMALNNSGNLPVYGVKFPSNSFKRHEKLNRMSKKAIMKDKKLWVKGYKKFDKELVEAFNKTDFGKMSGMSVKPEELYKQAGNAKALYDEYNDMMASMDKQFAENGRYNIVDIKKSEELYNKMFAAQFEFWSNYQKNTRIQQVFEMQNTLARYVHDPANESSMDDKGNLIVKVGDKNCLIRPNERYSDIVKFYNTVVAYEAAQQPVIKTNVGEKAELTKEQQERVDRAMQKKGGAISNTSPAKAQTTVVNEPLKEDTPMTPELRAYAEYLASTIMDDITPSEKMDMAVKVATDPANKDKFEAWDAKYGVTAFMKAKEDGLVRNGESVSDFQYAVAYEDLESYNKRKVDNQHMEASESLKDDKIAEVHEQYMKAYDDLEKQSKGKEAYPFANESSLALENTSNLGDYNNALVDNSFDEDFEPEDTPDYAVNNGIPANQPADYVENNQVSQNVDMSGIDVFVDPQVYGSPMDAQTNSQLAPGQFNPQNLPSVQRHR